MNRGFARERRQTATRRGPNAPFGPARPFAMALVALSVLCVVHFASAQAPPTAKAPGAPAAEPKPKPSNEEPAPGSLGMTPKIGPVPDLGPLVGRRLTRISVVDEGVRFRESVALRLVRLGDLVTPELARRALRELTDSGRFAAVRAEVRPDGDGAELVLVVLPRRIVAAIRLNGGVLDPAETLRVGEVREQGEITDPDLPRISERIRALYVEHGFPAARIATSTSDTDDPLRVLVLIDVEPGKPLRITRRLFGVWPSIDVVGLADVLAGYGVEEGDRLDEDELKNSDRALEQALRGRGWHRASVDHRVDRGRAGGATLHVLVRAGPLMRLRFEGNRHFDAVQLEESLELETSEDRSATTLVERLRTFYVHHGFLDVEVEAKEQGGDKHAIHDLVFAIREHDPVRVVGREYPCLTGERSAADVGSEIDSFLSEELPGAEFFGPVDPRRIDATFGPTAPTGARPPPYDPNPYVTYDADVYERAMKHVQELYRSEGYLSATVGPAQLLRRKCKLRSPAGQCIPVGPRLRPPTQCLVDAIGLPLEEPAPGAAYTCTPDPKKGLRCEPEVVLDIPIKLGPRSMLWDIEFEGNHQLVEKDLAEAAELELGKPASQVELDKARRKVLDAYAEEGFAFAEVDAELELSPDHTRARARFTISERERVIVSGIVIHGADRTREGLIRERVALEVGKPYRRSLVRRTEELLATLGVFSTVTVGFEDPYVPAREKVVVITVVERKPQYLDIRPGFSTGEGFRITFEYGHRNLAGEAIQLTLRSQLGYLPNAFILEDDVRRKYDELDVGERLERRNTATIEFPDIGLGPLFRLSVEGLDVRDNARDYGLTKDAGFLTLIFRPARRFNVSIGPSLERNDARIFGTDQKGALQAYVQANPQKARIFRVPEGPTLAVAERLTVTWDRRDNPLGATRGTFVSAGVEHVHATPIGANATSSPSPSTDLFAATKSDFLRWTNRIGGYVRLSEKGLALALSFRWGYNQQLIAGSKTYPDRLFFMGGVDSLRGFLQDSMVPEDIAQELLNPSSGLTLQQVVIRGGDVFINPRTELRIPLSANVQTALFIDAGNLWTDPTRIDPLRLRYAAGSGLRIGTPIGPLVFDYGFNVERVLDRIFPDRPNQRFWEDIGAFHFSIGLF